jgi:hypothetical protein
LKKYPVNIWDGLISCITVKPATSPFSFYALVPALAVFVLIAGCSQKTAAPNLSDAAEQNREQAQTAAKKIDTARQALEEIPPPAKSRYMVIHTTESWSNPFLVVGSDNLTLRVIYPDMTHSNALPSAMLKPARARRQELTIRISDLPDALGALPVEEWPYGRVVAVEEDPAETRANRLQVRRNVETTMQALNNLGIVIYEWPAPNRGR